MKNCLRVLSTTLAGFLFFSNFSSIVAMSSKLKKSFNSSEYSGDLEEVIYIKNKSKSNSSHNCFISEKEIKYLAEKSKCINDKFEYIKNYFFVPRAYEIDGSEKAKEFLINLKFENMHGEYISVLKELIIYLKKKMKFINYIQKGNVWIYVLNHENINKSVNVCLIVRSTELGFELFPGLGEIDSNELGRIIICFNEDDLISSLKRSPKLFCIPKGNTPYISISPDKKENQYGDEK